MLGGGGRGVVVWCCLLCRWGCVGWADWRVVSSERKRRGEEMVI